MNINAIGFGVLHSILYGTNYLFTLHTKFWHKITCNIFFANYYYSHIGKRKRLCNFFLGFVPKASQSPYLITVYFLGNCRPHLSHFGQKFNFRDPNLVTFYLCSYLINPLNRSSKNELTHFLINCMNEEHFTFRRQYKYSGTFANRRYEQLFYPKNPKLCEPTLVTLLKMQPHYSQSSCENATPSNSTSPLASYKEVPPPPAPPRGRIRIPTYK